MLWWHIAPSISNLPGVTNLPFCMSSTRAEVQKRAWSVKPRINTQPRAGHIWCFRLIDSNWFRILVLQVRWILKAKFGPSCFSLTKVEPQVWCATMLRILYAVWWVVWWPCEKTIAKCWISACGKDLRCVREHRHKRAEHSFYFYPDREVLYCLCRSDILDIMIQGKIFPFCRGLNMNKSWVRFQCNTHAN